MFWLWSRRKCIYISNKIEGISFIEAVQTLAERSNIQLPTLENTIDSAKEELKAKVLKVNEFTAQYYHENLYKPESKIAQEYIKKRKLSNETLKSFRLGFQVDLMNYIML